MSGLVGLQMISLLIFNHLAPSSSSSAAGTRSSRCISSEQVTYTEVRYQRTHGSRWLTQDRPGARRTCAAAEMSAELRDRSLAPWRFSINREDDRIPREISFAECLCHGCVIDQREDVRYNSVPVFAPLMVMRKTPCPRDPDKFVVSRDWIKVPVGCTCARPKYTKRSTGPHRAGRKGAL
ncbi:il17c [Pungitius sinensis]